MLLLNQGEVDMEVIFNNESKLVIVYMCPLQLPIFLQQPLTELIFKTRQGYVIFISPFDDMFMVKAKTPIGAMA